MELTQLRYFRTIAREGSMTAAARVLRVSQPTLSVAVRKLEEELDTTLFLRDRRGVRLTATGQEVLNTADRVLEIIEQTVDRVHGLETEMVGHFILGCPEALGAYFLPDFMATFLVDAPRVELALWNAPSPEVRRAVVSREVQFGIVVNPLPHPDLTLVSLFDDATDFFVATSRFDVNREVHALIEAGPLIYVDHLPQSQSLLSELSKQKMLPRRQLVCGDLEMVKSLALAGVGVAILPRRVAAYGQPGKLTRLSIDLPYIEDTIHLIYRADVHRTKAALRLKNALVAHGKAH